MKYQLCFVVFLMQFIVNIQYKILERYNIDYHIISSGIVPKDLLLFLDTTLPKPGKKEKLTLGVADAKLGAAITEALSIQCNHIGPVPEIIRGNKFAFRILYIRFSLSINIKYNVL